MSNHQVMAEQQPSTRTIALVTGANKGIGYEIARGLGAKGMIVLMGARDEDRGKKAAESLRAEGIQARAVRLDLGVTVHAGFGCRNRGVCGFIDGRVTIETVHPQLARMQLMAVGHGLDRLVSRVDDRRVGVISVGSNSDQRAQTDQDAGDLENEVRRLRKDRSHLEFVKS